MLALREIIVCVGLMLVLFSSSPTWAEWSPQQAAFFIAVQQQAVQQVRKVVPPTEDYGNVINEYATPSVHHLASR